MRHQHDRDAFLAVELRQGLHDLVRGARIKIAGRLVGEEQYCRVPVSQTRVASEKFAPDPRFKLAISRAPSPVGRGNCGL
jgi:hypothetical protein